jgi:hypothetical protein
MASKAGKTDCSKRMCASCIKETLFNESEEGFFVKSVGSGLM